MPTLPENLTENGIGKPEKSQILPPLAAVWLAPQGAVS
jgi:hypothetical protein